MAGELKPLRVKVTTFPGIEHIMIVIDRKSTIAKLKEEIQETLQRVFPYRSQAPISNIRKDNNKVLIPDWYPIEPVLQDNEEVFISHDLLTTNCGQCLVMTTPNPSYNGSFDSCPNQTMRTYQPGQNIDQTPESYHGQMPVTRNSEENIQHLHGDIQNMGLNPLDVSFNSLVNRIMENEEKEVNKESREGESDESESILKRKKVIESEIDCNIDQVAGTDQTVCEDAEEESAQVEMKESCSENEIKASVDSELMKMEVTAENATATLVEVANQKRKISKKKKKKAINNEDSFETLLTDDTMTDLIESGIGSDSTANILTKKNLEMMEHSEINPKENEDKDKESYVSEDKEKVPLAADVKENTPLVNSDVERAHKFAKDGGILEDGSVLSDVGDASQQEYKSSQKSQRSKSKKRRKDQENDAKSVPSKYEEGETELGKKNIRIRTESDREAMEENDAGNEGNEKVGCNNDSASFTLNHEEAIETQSHRSKKRKQLVSDSALLPVKEPGLALQNRDTACKDKLASEKLDEVETKSTKSKKKRHKNADLGWEEMVETSSAIEKKEEEERSKDDCKSVAANLTEIETQSTKSKKKRRRNAESDWEAMADTSSALESKEEEERCKNECKAVTANLTEIETQSTKSKKKRRRNAESNWEAMADTSSALESKEEEERCKNDGKSVTASLTEIETQSTKSKKKRHRNAESDRERADEAAIARKDKDDSCFKTPAVKKRKPRRKSILEETQDSSQTKKSETASFDYETDNELTKIQAKITTVVDEIVITESDFSTTNEPLKFTKEAFTLKNDATSTIDSTSKKEVSNSKKEVSNSKKELADHHHDRASKIIATQNQMKSDNAKKDESSKERKEKERNKKKRKGNKELLGTSDTSTSSISFSDYKGGVVSKETGNKARKEKTISRHSSKKSKKGRKQRKSSTVSNTEKSVAKVHDWLSKLTDDVEQIPIIEEYQETVSTEVNETKIESKELSFSVLESAVALETIPEDGCKETGNDLKGASKGDAIMSSEKGRGEESTAKDTANDTVGVTGDKSQLKGRIKSPEKQGKESSENAKCNQQRKEDTSNEKKGIDVLKKNPESENIGEEKTVSPKTLEHITCKTVKSKQSIKEAASNEKMGKDGGRKNAVNETVEMGKRKSQRKNIEQETCEKDKRQSQQKNGEQETGEKDKRKSLGSKQHFSSETVKGKQVINKEANIEKNKKDCKGKNIENEDWKGKSAENKEHAEEDIDMNDSFDETFADFKFESLVEDGASLISSKVKQPLKKLSTTPTYVQKSLNGFLSSAQQKRFENKKKAEMKSKPLKGKLNKTVS